MPDVSVILLCGGKGTRMGSSVPKQYLKLKKKPLAIYSFDFFSSLEEVFEIIVVCEKKYERLFQSDSKLIKFATPGERRQDSVFNGLQLAEKELVCIHDGARPFLKKEEVSACFAKAKEHGAAILGSKVQNTIKMTKGSLIEKTLKRDYLYEAYTPQVIKKTLLREGFALANQNNLTITDDAGLVENLGKPVFIVEGSKENIKITTPIDLKLAKLLLYEKTL